MHHAAGFGPVHRANSQAPIETHVTEYGGQPLNRMLGEARGGLLDIDLSTILGEQDALSAALLLGPAGPEMADYIPPTSTVQLNAQALMHPLRSLTTL